MASAWFDFTPCQVCREQGGQSVRICTYMQQPTGPVASGCGEPFYHGQAGAVSGPRADMRDARGGGAVRCSGVTEWSVAIYESFLENPNKHIVGLAWPSRLSGGGSGRVIWLTAFCSAMRRLSGALQRLVPYGGRGQSNTAAAAAAAAAPAAPPAADTADGAHAAWEAAPAGAARASACARLRALLARVESQPDHAWSPGPAAAELRAIAEQLEASAAAAGATPERKQLQQQANGSGAAAAGWTGGEAVAGGAVSPQGESYSICACARHGHASALEG